MAEALQDRILAIGRDALVWVDKVRKLHAQMQNKLHNIPEFEHNPAMLIENRLNFMLGEISALNNSIQRLMLFDHERGTWEIPPSLPLGQLERIRKAYLEILNVAKMLLAVLKPIKEGIAEELKDDDYITRDLAGLEKLERDINEVTAQPAHSAVKQLIRWTRYRERDERTLSRDVQAVLRKVNKMVLLLEAIIPRFSEWKNELGDSTEAILPRVLQLEKQNDRQGMTMLFTLYSKAASKMCDDKNIKRIRRLAIKLNSVSSRIESIGAGLKNLEANVGTIIKDLDEAIKKFERRGWLEKAAA